jgi:hypothetical protein
LAEIGQMEMKNLALTGSSCLTDHPPKHPDRFLIPPLELTLICQGPFGKAVAEGLAQIPDFRLAAILPSIAADEAFHGDKLGALDHRNPTGRP